MILSKKQRLFAVKISEFILRITKMGYEVTFGEAWRPTETAKIYAAQGKGIANSLHSIRLAVDLNLFKNGKYTTDNGEYEEIGVLWEKMSDGEVKCCWGGRFGDGNHFSFEHNGVK